MERHPSDGALSDPWGYQNLLSRSWSSAAGQCRGRELVGYAGERLFIISNNSTDTPRALAAKLARRGLRISEDRIGLAGAAAVRELAETGHSIRVAIYGSPVIIDYAKSMGLILDWSRPDHVLLTRDVRFSYGRLHRVVEQIERGAVLIVSNNAGARVFETGVLLETIRACLPSVAYRSIGKPSAALYRAAMGRFSAQAAELLAIGDNPSTDGEGARRMGMNCVLVGTAKAAQFESLMDTMHGGDLAFPAIAR